MPPHKPIQQMPSFEVVDDHPFDQTQQDQQSRSYPAPAGPATDQQMPEFTTEQSVRPQTGIIGQLAQHALGTDVNDHIPNTRLVSSITGALAGGVIGAKVGTVGAAIPGVDLAINPVTMGLAGSAVGGALGAAMPETVMGMGEALGLVPKGTQKKYGLPPADLQHFMTDEAVLDLVTGGGVEAARMGGRTVGRALTGISKAGTKTADDAAAVGINLLPIQVGDRSLPRTWVSVMGRMPMMAGVFIKRAQETQNAITTAFKELPTRIAPAAAASNASLKIFTTAKNLSKDLSDHFTGQFENLYQRAEAAGVRTSPGETMGVVDDIGNEIKTMAANGGAVPKDVKDVQGFINSTFKGMFQTDTKGNVKALNQTWKQMDTLNQVIENKEADLAKRGLFDSIKYLERIKSAVKTDMLTNSSMIQPGGIGGGRAVRNTPQIGQFIAEHQALDQQFTNTIADVYQSGAGKQLFNVGKSSQRGAINATLKGNIQPHNIADVLMGSENPQAVIDLIKLAGRNTDVVKGVAADIVQQRINGTARAATSKITDQTVYDGRALEKAFGLDDKTGQRYQFMKTLLDQTGGLSIDHVEKLVNAAKAAGSVEIPNRAVYLTRRAGIAGIRGVLSAVSPMGVAHAIGGSAAGIPAIGIASVVGGSRLFGRLISNPSTARSIRTVLSDHASSNIKMQSLFNVIRMDIDTDGTLGAGEKQKQMQTLDAIKWYYDQTGGKLGDAVSQGAGFVSDQLQQRQQMNAQ
jgi:hypothetical protein